LEGTEFEDFICEQETLACKDIDETKWERARIYLDGVEVPQSAITYGNTFQDDRHTEVFIDNSIDHPKPRGPNDEPVELWPGYFEWQNEQTLKEKGWWNSN